MTSKVNEIELTQITICDDVRHESNGKFILVGVYLDSIIMNSLPADISLAIWMQFTMYLNESTSLEFEVKGDALKETIKYVFDINDPKIFGRKQTVPLIAKMPFSFIREGSFDIYYKIKNDKKFKHVRKMIVKNIKT